MIVPLILTNVLEDLPGVAARINGMIAEFSAVPDTEYSAYYA